MAALALLPLVALVLAASGPLRASLSAPVQAVLVLAAVYGLHRLLIAGEDRGWVHYRKRRGSYGGLGVKSEWLNMYDPSRRHVQQAVRMHEWQRDEDDDGDDPAPGTRR